MIKRNSNSAKEYLGKTVLFKVPFPIHEKVDGQYIVTGYEDKPVRYQAVEIYKGANYRNRNGHKEILENNNSRKEKRVLHAWVKSKRPVDFDMTLNDVVMTV